MAEERERGPGLFVAAALAIALAYGAAYTALVVPVVMSSYPGAYEIAPSYRRGGEAAYVLFGPAHAIDRRVRRRLWSEWPAAEEAIRGEVERRERERRR
jgi:hypothetical protein